MAMPKHRAGKRPPNRLLTDAFREIKNTKSRFISLLVLSALAVCFLAGLRATAPDMKLSADRYFDQQQLMDLRVVSTLALTDEDIQALKQEEGVVTAEGAYTLDAILPQEENDYIVKLHSLTKETNLPHLLEGRLPEKPNELLVEPLFTKETGIRVGDVVELDTGDGDFADALNYDEFTVVGVADSPLYISVDRGSSSLGTGRVTAFVLVPEEAFNMEFYTDAYLRMEGAQALPTYSEEYSDLMDQHISRIEQLSEIRAPLRGQQVIDEAYAKLAEAEQELADGRAEADARLNDAKAQLDDARKQLDEGWAQYWDGVREMEQQLADAEAQLNEAEAQLNQAKADLDKGWQEYRKNEKLYQSGLKEYEAGEAQYRDGLAQYNSGMADLAEAKAQLDSGEAQYAQGKRMLDQLSSTVFNLLRPRLAPLGVTSPRQMMDALDAGDPQVTNLVDGLLNNTSSGVNRAVTETRKALERLQGQNIEFVPVPGQVTAPLRALLNRADLPPELKTRAEHTLSILESGRVSEQDLADALKELDQMDGYLMLPASSRELVAQKRLLDDSRAQLDQGWTQYNSGLAQLNRAKADLDDARRQLDQGKRQMDDAKQQLDAGKRQLEDGQRQYDEGMAQLTDGRRELEEQSADGKARLDQAHAHLLAGEEAYASGLAEYNKGRAEADAQLLDAQDQIDKARRDIENIEECQWYVLDRNTNMGYVSYSMDADRMGNLASVFPLIFFLVAALVCLTTMTRMVEEQRVAIGGLKALGYSRGAIAIKYVGYGFLASTIGSIIGLVIGLTLLPWIICSAWAIMYTTGEIYYSLEPLTSVIACAAAIGTVTLSAWGACFSALTAVPAQLMRPKAPPMGKRILLERIRPLWSRLSFNYKVTLRNLFRYKRRFWMTVIGIGGCAALIVTAFGLRDSLFDVMDKQYDELYTYTAQVGLVDKVTPGEVRRVNEALEESGLADAWHTCQSEMVTGSTDAYTLDAYLRVMPDDESMGRFIDLRHRTDNEPVVLDDNGVILTEKMAKMLEVEPGDTFTMDGEKRVELTVSDVTENYIQHYIYMSDAYYETIFGEAPEQNMVLVDYDTEDPQAKGLAAQLVALDGVTSLSLITDTRKVFTSSLESVDYAVVLIIVCAAALAFVVLYNLTNINITERMRELATLKVLGFYDPELSAYVYRENVILTFFGVAMGMFMGKLLHHWLVLTVEIDMLMFGRDLQFTSYAWATVLTIIFSLAVNLLAHWKLKKLDMVESLKTVE